MSHEPDVPKIRLGGRQWAVPLLAARQNKLIDPLILRLLPLFSTWRQDPEAALAQIGQEQYDALLDIAYYALLRAYPTLSRDEFLECPVTLAELIAAFSTIAQQTGLFKPSAEDAAPGEAKAGNARTGTESSPMSAI